MPLACINDLERPIGMYLYRRKMYQTMAIWNTPDVIPPDVIPGGKPAMLDFAQVWQADKIVYSRSLEAVSTPKTRLEREFDPQAVRDLKAQLPQDLSVGGPTLATRAIRTGLVKEMQLLALALAVPRSRWRHCDHRAGSSALRSPRLNDRLARGA